MIDAIFYFVAKQKTNRKNIYFVKYVDWFYWKSYDPFFVIVAVVAKQKTSRQKCLLRQICLKWLFFLQNRKQVAKIFILPNMLINFIEKAMTRFFFFKTNKTSRKKYLFCQICWLILLKDYSLPNYCRLKFRQNMIVITWHKIMLLLYLHKKVRARFYCLSVGDKYVM